MGKITFFGMIMILLIDTTSFQTELMTDIILL